MTTSPLGSSLSWTRDFALIGAVTGVAAPAPYFLSQHGYLATCGAAGAVVGALVGFVASKALVGPFARWPFGVLLVLGLCLGALWGGLAGFAGGAVALDDTHSYVTLTPISTIAGAGAGMIQLGWFWLPYALRRAKQKSALPIVVAACAISAALGVASLTLLHGVGKAIG